VRDDQARDTVPGSNTTNLRPAMDRRLALVRPEIPTTAAEGGVAAGRLTSAEEAYRDRCWEMLLVVSVTVMFVNSTVIGGLQSGWKLAVPVKV
jgi:hypothetical protein